MESSFKHGDIVLVSNNGYTWVERVFDKVTDRGTVMTLKHNGNKEEWRLIRKYE